jgi:hypothetical protein
MSAAAFLLPLATSAIRHFWLDLVERWQSVENYRSFDALAASRTIHPGDVN